MYYMDCIIVLIHKILFVTFSLINFVIALKLVNEEYVKLSFLPQNKTTTNLYEVNKRMLKNQWINNVR